MKVIELFAGVGGFRIGLQNASEKYRFVWANQWEPNTKTQTAFEIYENNFGKKSCVNEDITKVIASSIPDHDLLTAGFPCQDYSVAKSLKYSGGIEGKKGVLWWEVVKVLKEKSPKYALLENVDRLLSSPSKQKGRDFAIILKTLQDLNYFVEWRIINAAEYGMPQKRKRIFIFASKKTTDYYLKKSDKINDSILNKALPITYEQLDIKKYEFANDVFNISETFGKDMKKSIFQNSGYLDKEIITYKSTTNYAGNKKVLKDIIVSEEEVPKEFWINDNEITSWHPFKLGRKIERVDKKTGFKYIYAEGKMSFPDSLENPARTIITGEGGKSPSRFKHVIIQNKKYRRLLPLELERINMFPDNHTKGVSDIKRAFLMGNALVTGVVEKIGKEIIKL